MKLVTANIHDRTFIGLIFNEDSVIDIQKAELKLYESEISPASLQACIEMGEKFVRHIEALQEWVAKEKERETYVYPLSAVKLQAPIPRPKKNIMCVGKNYRDHVAEMGSESDIPSDLILFSKPSTSVIAHEGEIDPHLYLTDELDYEGELAVVIGKKENKFAKKKPMTTFLDIRSSMMSQQEICKLATNNIFRKKLGYIMPDGTVYCT